MYNDTIKSMNIIHTKAKCNEDYYLSKNITLGTKYFENESHKPLTYVIDENSYTIVYSGKIYNYTTLKKELEEYGYIFSTDFEEELLIKGFLHFGYNICEKLNGMFSFAIWNEKKEELFLAKDHFGIKPLYYSLTNR